MNREEWREWRRNLARPNDKVAMGYLSGGSPAFEFVESALNTYQLDLTKGARRFDFEGWRIAARSGVNITRTRNAVVRKFLANPAQPAWLWMVDDDMAWNADALEQMMAAAQPDRVLGGLCFAYGPEGRIIPTIFEVDEAQRYVPMPDDYKVPRDTLLQVAGTGAAFLLVHREALVKMAHLLPATPNPWFRDVELQSVNQETGEVAPYWISEDLFFCRQAYLADLTVWVHTGVEVKHRKEHFLTRGLYESDTSGIEWA